MDLGEALSSMDDRLDYSGRHEVISTDAYESRFDKNVFTEYDGPVLFMHPRDKDQFCLNSRLVEQIHAKDLQPILYITSEALDYLSDIHLSGRGITGHWDIPFQGRLVMIIKWVEDNRDPENGKGGVEMTIQRHRNYVWMIDHSQDKNYDIRLNMWKAEWRD